MISAADDFLGHPAESADPRWFDRFWVNAHSIDGSVTISQGIGVYANVGVIDGFAIVARGRDQRIVRASREGDSSRLQIGPIEAEIVEPLRRWRFRLDAANEAGIAYDFEFRGTFEPIDCGRMRDWSHFVQAGVADGKLAIDGREIAVDPSSWRAGRDRSWGVRSESRGRFNWVCAQLPSLHLWYLLVVDRAGAVRVAEGWIRHSANQGGSVERIEQISPQPAFDAGGAFRSAEVEIATGSGSRRFEFRRLDSTVFLRGGLYGGWKGKNQGDRRGSLLLESERWNLGVAPTLGEVAGLNDHVCEVSSGDERGVGIFELNHGV